MSNGNPQRSGVRFYRRLLHLSQQILSPAAAKIGVTLSGYSLFSIPATRPHHPMKPQYDCLYKELTTQLEKLHLLPLTDLQRAESGLWLALSGWHQLNAMVKNKIWSGPEEEIDFFRNTKPALTSLIYYHLLHAKRSPASPMRPASAPPIGKTKPRAMTGSEKTPRILSATWKWAGTTRMHSTFGHTRPTSQPCSSLILRMVTRSSIPRTTCCSAATWPIKNLPGTAGVKNGTALPHLNSHRRELSIRTVYNNRN